MLRATAACCELLLLAQRAARRLPPAAHVAEVSVDAAGRPRVHRIVAAVDCGRVVNPSGAEAQVQGGVMDGLTAALFGRITVE